MFEEEYLDVLHNIETGIVLSWRAEPMLADHDVIEALEACIRFYNVQERGDSPRRPTLSPKAELVFNKVEALCEWRLGRRRVPFEGEAEPEPFDDMPAKTLEEILRCLRTVSASVKRHNRYGRTEYLEFIREHLP